MIYEMMLNAIGNDSEFQAALGINPNTMNTREATNLHHQLVALDGEMEGLIYKRDRNGFAVDGPGLFSARQLEYMSPEFFEAEHKPLKFREYFPIDSSLPEGLETMTYKMYDYVGKMTPGKDRSNEAGEYETVMTEETLKSHKDTLKVVITTEEMRQSIFTGIPIEPLKFGGAIKGGEQKLNQFFMYGEVSRGIKGLLNTTNILETQVALGASGLRDWPNKSFLEIKDDIGTLVQAVRQSTFRNHEDNFTLLIAGTKYDYIGQTPVSTLNTQSILNWLLDNLKGFGINRIEPFVDLEDAGPGATDMMFLFENNKNVIRLPILINLRWIPPQLKGFDIIFHAELKALSLQTVYPKGARRAYGI